MALQQLRPLAWIISASLALHCNTPLDSPEIPAAISGYTDRFSYQPGDTLRLHLSADTSYARAQIRLFDMAGAMIDWVTTSVEPQFAELSAPWANGFGYAATFSYILPNLASGIYTWEQKVPFVLRPPRSGKPVLVAYPSNTAAAYNSAGGKSLYDYNSSAGLAADSVSFHRPTVLQDETLACLDYFAEQETGETGFLADADLDDFANLMGSRLLIVIGHSEYWTRRARENFDRFVDAGGHALILSGNTMWWQVRYSKDMARLMGYKDAGEDPVADPLLRTVLWNHPDLNYPILPSIGADFDLGGYGLQSDDGGWDGMKIIAPEAPFLSGTGLAAGDIIALPSAEYDGTVIAGSDSSGYPLADKDIMGFESLQIIGYDLGFRFGPTVGTWILFRKSASSGWVINVGASSWCSAAGLGGAQGPLLRQITSQMIAYLLSL